MHSYTSVIGPLLRGSGTDTQECVDILIAQRLRQKGRGEEGYGGSEIMTDRVGIKIDIYF